MEFAHTSVLLGPAVDGLNVREGGIYADCTTGGGGHSLEIAKRLGNSGKLICFDRDSEAIEAAQKRLAGFSPVFVHRNFCEIKDALRELGISHLDGAIMDPCTSDRIYINIPQRFFQ